MFKQAYYKGLIKIAQGIPYNPAQHDLPRQWFTDRGYTQDQYNEYKGKGYSLSPFTRGQFIRRKIDLERKAEQLRKAYKEQYGDDVPKTVSGIFGNGKLIRLDGAEPREPVLVPPLWSEQARQRPTQPIGVMKQIPVQQPVYTRNKQIRKVVPAQAPAVGPDTRIRHKGYTWQAFSDGAAARKHYGGNVVGTKINGQTYYRPFDTTGGTRTGSYVRSTQNASRPGKRVVVPAYRRVL